MGMLIWYYDSSPSKKIKSQTYLEKLHQEITPQIKVTVKKQIKSLTFLTAASFKIKIFINYFTKFKLQIMSDGF